MLIQHTNYVFELLKPIFVAVRSKEWVCGRSLLGLRVRFPPWAGMSVSCEFSILSTRVCCDGPILRPEQPYQGKKDQAAIPATARPPGSAHCKIITDITSTQRIFGLEFGSYILLSLKVITLPARIFSRTLLLWNVTTTRSTFGRFSEFFRCCPRCV
jgi:hypothetical protein